MYAKLFEHYPLCHEARASFSWLSASTRLLQAVYSRSPSKEAIAMPDRPSVNVYENTIWNRSFNANRPRFAWSTVEPNSLSPGLTTGINDCPPDTSRKMPVGLAAPNDTEIAENATALRLLSEGCSVLANAGFAGLFRGANARAFPVKISGASNGSRKATSATVPTSLITGSPKELRIPTMPITHSDLMAITIPSDADHRRSEATLGISNHAEVIGIRQSFCN